MKKETNLIWELIEESFKEEETSLYKKLNEYYMSVISPMLESKFKTINEYLIDVYGEKDYYKAEENFFIFKVLVDKDKDGIFKRSDFDSQLHNLIQDQIDRNKWKLKCSVFGTMAGITIKDCHKIEFRRSIKGFQGVWGFTTIEGEKATFETKAVFASGPIKCDHYRYVSHIVGNSNIQTDNRLRNEILKKLKEENPELKKKLTPEEKELKKRTEKAEAEVRNAKWWYENCLESIEKNKKYLADLAPEKLLGVKEELREQYCNELKDDYTKELQRKETELPKCKKRLQQAEEDLILVKNTDLTQVNNDLTLKKDKKRIKELKDSLNGYSLQTLKKKDLTAYQLKFDNLTAELNELYVKYPEIKKKEIRSQIKHYETMLSYAKVSVNQTGNTPEFTEQKKKDIEEYNQKIKNLQTL